MRFLSSALIASLVLNGIALPASVRAAEEEQVCATGGFTPAANSDPEIATKCPAGPRSADCVNTRKGILQWNTDYKKLAEEACQKHRDSVTEINELNQNSAFGEVKSKAEAGIADINTLLAANKKILDKIPTVTSKNLEALKQFSASSTATPVYKKRVGDIGAFFTRSRQRPDVMREKIFTGSDNSGISGTEASASKAQIEALGESQLFVRSLLTDKEKNEAAIRELTQARNDAVKSMKNSQTADEGNSKSEGSGFNPMSLLPLAAPLAGLLMQQKQQESGLSDGLPPNDPYGISNSPAPLAGTSLDPKTNQSPGPTPITNPKSPDTDMHMPTEAYAGGGAVGSSFGGDISQGSGEGKSSGMPAGSFSANSGGSSDSSGASATPGKSDRKPANHAAAASEEGLINAGGGGGAFSASSSTDSAVAEEGSMKDMLNDMEATLEDVPTGLFAEAEHQGSNDGVAPENSESLFPRVRACYVRSLKKGFVLNGLGEKLPESESH